MTQPAALPDLNDVAARSGFDKEMVAFLKQKGISNSGLFLHFFKDSGNIGPFWEPLRAGVEIHGSTVNKSDDERLILEAATKVALDELTLMHTQLMSPTAPASASPSGSQSQASQSEVTEKVPKVLPKNYWSEYVKEFESVTLLGRNRVFPAHLLLGAEEVLSRMVHQHQSSKQYSPVRLGEIISLRHFTPSKSANPFAPKDDSKTRLILDESGTFTKASRQVPEPQKLVTMLDAMFARWCDEHDASVWAEFWQNLCRDYPSRTPQVRAFFDEAFLHVTLQMRASKSFSEASAEVRSWPKQDELNRPAPSENTEPRRTKGDFGQKGDHKGHKGKSFDSWKGFEPGKGKGFLRPWQPHPYRPAAQFTQPRPPCRLFAQGYCKFGASCKFALGNQAPNASPQGTQFPPVVPAAPFAPEPRPEGQRGPLSAPSARADRLQEGQKTHPTLNTPQPQVSALITPSGALSSFPNPCLPAPSGCAGPQRLLLAFP